MGRRNMKPKNFQRLMRPARTIWIFASKTYFSIVGVYLSANPDVQRQFGTVPLKFLLSSRTPASGGFIAAPGGTSQGDPTGCAALRPVTEPSFAPAAPQEP